MRPSPVSVDDVYLWQEGALRRPNPANGVAAEILAAPIMVADSWLVADGTVLALALHRARFLSSVQLCLGDGPGSSLQSSPHSTAVATDAQSAGAKTRYAEAAAFWDAAVALLPRTGDWFPRVELRGPACQPKSELQCGFVLRLRPAPERSKSTVVASIVGEDPRTQPQIKGPDLESMAQARAQLAGLGAQEAIVLTPEGYVVEGGYSGLLWWRGNILCGAPGSFDRVDSVTVRSVLALAIALGVETHEEAVTPAELAGTELWALGALHGIRIVTRWVNGPDVAELPGRLATWRARLGALRQPL